MDNTAPEGPVLVTGCAGMIGARVTELLLESGSSVVGIDNLNDAYDVRLKNWRLDRIRERPNLEFHRLDVTERPALDRLFADAVRQRDGDEENGPPFRGVINLAARAGVRQSLQQPQEYYETNVSGTINLLELCRHYGVPKFVQASTSSLYGRGVDPVKQERNGRYSFSEDDNTDRALSPYAASKKASETLCYTYHYLYGIDVTVLRYFTVYGPVGRPDMSLFRFVQWISEGRPVTVYGDGKQTRDFTYVDDVARGTIAGLRPLGFEVINIGSDNPIVLDDAIQMIASTVGKPAIVEHRPSHPADVKATWANIAKAGHLLGWRPSTAFQQGIDHLVDWYRENREWASTVRTS